MVISNNRANGTYLDIKAIQNDGRMDQDLRGAIISEAKVGLKLLSPADKVNLGLGLSNTPGMNMTGDSGEILVQLQDQNQNLQAHNNQLGQRVADLTAQNDALRAQAAGGNP
jgi:hypothetical protein